MIRLTPSSRSGAGPETQPFRPVLSSFHIAPPILRCHFRWLTHKWLTAGYQPVCRAAGMAQSLDICSLGRRIPPQQTLGFQALNYRALKQTKLGVWRLLCWSQYHSTEANRGQVHLMPSPQGSSVDISDPVIGHTGLLTSICIRIPQGLGMCSLLEHPEPQNHSCHTTDNHQGAVAMHSRSIHCGLHKSPPYVRFDVPQRNKSLGVCVEHFDFYMLTVINLKRPEKMGL